MTALFEIGLGNAVAAVALALLAAVVSRLHPRPALAHALWLLVLIKLVTPPLAPVPVLPSTEDRAASQAPLSVVGYGADVDAPTAEPIPDARQECIEPRAEPPLAEEVLLGEPPVDEDALAATAAAPTVHEPIPAAVLAASASGPSWLRPYTVPAVLSLWAAGTFCWLVLTLVRIGRFRRMLALVRPVPVPLLTWARQLAMKFGLGECPEVWLLPGAVSPMLWALGRKPKLLLPAELMGRLDIEQQRALLAHELAHLKRRDHWVRALELLATGLFWWHPVLWWARRELREAEEQCCDAWVLWAMPGCGRAYALALMETLDYLAGAPRWAKSLPVAASGAGPFPILKRRFTMIMQGTTPRALGWTGVLGVLAVGAALLPWAPAWAQERERDRERREGERREEERRVIERREGERREGGERREAERREAEAREQAQRGREAAEREFRRAVELQHAERDRAAGLDKARAELQVMIERLEAERKRAHAELERARERIEALEREVRALRGRTGDVDRREGDRRPDRPGAGDRPPDRPDRPADRPADRPGGGGRPDARPGHAPDGPPGPGGGGPPMARFGARGEPMKPGPGLGGVGFGGGAMGGFALPGRDSERRLSELEKKMETLLQEMSELRKELRRGAPRGYGPTSPTAPATVAAPGGSPAYAAPPATATTPAVPAQPQQPGQGPQAAPAATPRPATAPRSVRPAPVPTPATVPAPPAGQPRSEGPAQPGAEGAITITVAKKDDGNHEIMVNGKRLEGDLAKTLKELMGEGGERKITVRVAPDVDFKVVRELAETAQKAGGKVSGGVVEVGSLPQ